MGPVDLALRWTCILPYFFFSWLLLGLVWREIRYDRRLALGLTLTVGWMTTATILFGRLTHDLGSAWLLGAGLSALIAGLLWRLGARLKGPGFAEFRFSYELIPTIAVFLLSSWSVWRVALRFAFHDQLMIQAHLPLIESISRGNLPPALTAFPEIPLKYHFGADVFGALVSHLTGLPAHRAIDVTQGLGWVLALANLYIFCREAGLSRGFSGIAMTWTMLGAGWAYLLEPWLAPHTSDAKNLLWPHSYIVFGRHLNPGTVSNFFMTPYSMGFPLFFAYLTCFSQWWKNRSYGWLAPCVLLLGALSIIQVTFFASLLTVTLFVLLVRAWRRPDVRKALAAQGLLLAGGSAALAWGLGGFFTAHPAYIGGSLLFHWVPGYLRNATWGQKIPITAGQAFLWYLATFGSLVFLALPFAALAVLQLRRRFEPLLFFLLVYAAQCLGIAQFMSYRLTWDIIKWFTGFHVAMLLAVVLVWSRLRPRAWLYALLAALCLADLVAPTRFLYDLAFRSPLEMPQDHRKWWSKTPALRRPDPNFQRVLSLLRQWPWSETVLAPYPFASAVAWHSGQSMAEVDSNTVFFGVGRETLGARNALIASLKKDFEWKRMAVSPIRWIIYPCRDFEKEFSPVSVQRIQAAVQSGALADYSFTNGAACMKIYRATRRIP